eukprot:CAMPEP_0174988822 /NCGR_PEP_ID=MMETSP0004_2-20121128/20356_1 /TAXON_ID=420556 /ORGANISM="Ochromonas sp., Strain CCMP1393" /LENGTH=338 /DNA_ID=CAMNT_0016242115 /DNA_START=184 /DNA_END=1200 /DNA_ORIENTATION=-
MKGIEDGGFNDYGSFFHQLKAPSSVYELNKRYKLSSHDVDEILRPLAHGHAGVIMSLDTVMVDLSTAFGYSFAILASDLNEHAPAPRDIKDLIGSSFKDCIISLGWNIPDEFVSKYELRFYKIFEAVLAKLPIESNPGVVDLIQKLIDDGNEITVITSLPRDIARNIMGRTQLARIFEERDVNPEHLICNDILNDTDEGGYNAEKYGDKYIGRIFIQCCHLMRRNTLCAVLVDGNRRHVLAAKRNGLSCVALSGFSANAQFLRSADQVASSVEDLAPKNLYQIIKNAVKQEEGPELQTDSVSVRSKIRTMQTSSPAMDNYGEEQQQDTFADGLDSDLQ